MAAFLFTNLFPTLQHVRSFRPDVMHVHFAVPTGALGYAVNKLTGAPYVMTTQLGDVPGGVPEQTDRLFRFLQPFTVPIWTHASAITAVSEHIRLLGKKAYGVDVQTLPNGIDMTGIQPNSGEIHDPVELVFAGRFNPQKNLGFLLDALVRISDMQWHMNMIGDGEEMPLVTNKIRDLGLSDRISLHGWITPDEVDGIMSRSDVLLMPSLSEGLPIVGLRALAFGLAIVGSNVGGIQDIVEDQVNGRLIDVGDSFGFEKALREIMSSNGRLSDLKKESFKLASRFDLNVIVDKFETLFQHAADKPT
jgi:glycosyltransferase involved in cell wall biosynthesis